MSEGSEKSGKGFDFKTFIRDSDLGFDEVQKKSAKVANRFMDPDFIQKANMIGLLVESTVNKFAPKKSKHHDEKI